MERVVVETGTENELNWIAVNQTGAHMTSQLANHYSILESLLWWKGWCDVTSKTLNTMNEVLVDLTSVWSSDNLLRALYIVYFQ